MTDVKIWRGGDRDVNDITRMEAAAFGIKSWGADGVRETLAASRVECFLGGADRAAPTGFLIWRCAGDEAEILTLGVHPDARRRGVAHALVAVFLESARENDVASAFLEVDCGNQRAICLYEAHGFLEIARRPEYYRGGGDAIVMQRRLQDE